MKKLILLTTIALGLFSCQEQVPKDYVTLSGKIADKNSEYLLVRSRRFQKKITVNADGTFSDTLKVKTGYFSLYDGKESTTIYLKDGFDLKMTLDTKLFDETVSYSGFGKEGNNYLAKLALLKEEVLDNKSLFLLEKEQFEVKMESVKTGFKNLLNKTEKVDSSFVAYQLGTIDKLTAKISNTYETQRYLLTVLAKGKAAPKFVDLENFNGGKTSLDDLKGKYVYIDVWATWCGPCKGEIPFLKNIEKEYHDKNIEFVSLSIDREKDHETWKKMVVDKELSGIQLFASADQKKILKNDYKITGIPRFILIDPAGNIVSAKAPRPSSASLKTLFDELSL